MITFQNVITQHVFVLPDDNALEIINQDPDIYKVISGIEKDLLVNPASQVASVDIAKDIYNLVVVSEACEDNCKKIVKKPKTVAKRKTAKRKCTKSKKKEK